MRTEPGLEPVARYANCAADRDATIVTCVVDRELAPGATVTVPATTNPLLVKVQEDAGGPYTYAVSVTATAVSEAAATGPGPRLTLEPTDAGAGDFGTVARFGVRVGTSSTHLDAVGATINGKIGDTTTVRVGASNAGPAATVPGHPATVRVTMPSGVEVTRVADGCTATGGAYTCPVAHRLRPSQPALFDFTARVVGAGHGTGRVTVDDAAGTGTGTGTAAITRTTTVSTTSTRPITGTLAVTAPLAAVLLATGAATFLTTRRRRGATGA